jgi:hypothetical protein
LDKKIIPALQKRDKDRILVIDGNEGGGKSTLAFQIGKYVDPTLNLSRVVFNAEDFREAVFKAKKCQCIIYDEAFTGLSSRSSLSGINRALVSLMMQMRQKNLFVLIVLPTFFLLDKYVALFRTVALIHVYEVRGRRGYFKIFSKRSRKILYLFGKQTYSYHHKKVYTNFKGRFYGNFALGDEKEEERYRKRKIDALQATESNPMSAGQAKYKEQRDILLHLLRKNMRLPYSQMQELLNEYQIDMSYVQIRNICAKFGDKEDKIIEKEGKIKEKEGKEPKNDENGDILGENDGFNSDETRIE